MEMEIFCLSNFAMGTILGKGFAQAQVHTEFIARVLEKNPFKKIIVPGEISFSNSTCIYICTAKKN